MIIKKKQMSGGGGPGAEGTDEFYPFDDEL